MLMKRILLLICTTMSAYTFSSFANAAEIGPYVGLGAGYDQVKTPEKFAFDVSADPLGQTSRTRNGWAGRGFAGYNINKFIGGEFGYTRWARALYKGTASGNYSSLTYYFHTYEYLLKGYLPLGSSGFNLYAIAGAARVVEILRYKNGGVPLNGNIATPTNSTTHSYKTRPMYGLGANFNYCHVTIAAEATQINRLGSFSSNPNAIPYLDQYSLSLAYNFG
jgi:hypothetical protein